MNNLKGLGITRIAKYSVIEKTAYELAGTWYEIGRSNGLTSKYKTAKAYARANIERWIPKAIEILTEMLGKNDGTVSEHMKQEIYEAILERSNAEGMEPLDTKEKKEQQLSIDKHSKEMIDKFKLPIEIWSGKSKH